jgi:hypothetical protein
MTAKALLKVPICSQATNNFDDGNAEKVRLGEMASAFRSSFTHATQGSKPGYQPQNLANYHVARFRSYAFSLLPEKLS